MVLQFLSLQHFRNYTQVQFSLSPETTIIIGQNGRGKSNLLEALFLLSLGKSFHAENDLQLIQFGKTFCRIVGKIFDDVTLEYLVSSEPGRTLPRKKYLVNDIARRRVDFTSYIPAVLFTPSHLDLVAGQPQLRRRFLDEVLEQTDRNYHLSVITYTKALRQRNALLQQAKETGVRDKRLFAYWDSLLLSHGGYIAKKRQEFLMFLNALLKDFFPFFVIYDQSEISKERLLQYEQAEIGAGVTLVGPHRDDFLVQMRQSSNTDAVAVKHFASRGQQRLVTLELKLAQIAYMQKSLGKKPLLLLDDIFSELDEANIRSVLAKVKGHQIVMTTTHKEFISGVGEKSVEMIELK